MPPAPQDRPLGQPPQLSSAPQPSPMIPQVAPAIAQVVGMQAPASLTLLPTRPHSPGTPPPPQISGSAHEPQFIRLPHRSAIGPHSTPSAWQVVGMQPASPPHLEGISAPQVWGREQ